MNPLRDEVRRHRERFPGDEDEYKVWAKDMLEALEESNEKLTVAAFYLACACDIGFELGVDSST